MTVAIPRRIGIVDNASGRRITVSACIEMALSQAPGIMDQVLDGLKLAAGLQPGKSAGSGAFRPELRPVIEQLLGQRDSLKNAFSGQLRVLSYGGVSDAGSRPLVRFEDIQLLDVHQLDQSIELARVQQELDFAVGEVLPRFNALMSAVMGWISVQPNINPLRPELFAKALRDTMAAHISIAEIRSEVLGSAAGRMGVALRQIYREMSEWMLSHGVEPAGVSAPTLTAVVTPGAAARTNETTRSILTLERLRRLLTADLGDLAAVTGRPGNDFLHTVPASVQALQDMKQVEAMIQRLESRKKEQASVSGNSAAQHVDLLTRAPLDGRQLGRQIGEEVTRMMIDNLVQDERLLQGVRDRLRQLQDSLLELSQSDVRFFSDHRHPARQFLDRVTDRSLAFTSENDEGYQRFLNSIESATAGIQSADVPAAMAFARELNRLAAIWQRDDKALLLLREETARKLLHVEQRNLLAQRLVDQWLHRMGDQPVPVLVRSFLAGPWAQVVAESQLNCTTGSSDPQGYLALVDDLIWSVQPQLARRNPVRLVEMIPSMLSTLRSGLQMIAYPSSRIGMFFDELIACHEMVLQEARQAREKAEASSPLADFVASTSGQRDDSASPDSMPSEAPWLGAEETAGAGYLEAEAVMPLDPSTLEVSLADQEAAYAASDTISEGAWVELMLDGEWTRLKLTWSSPHRTLFMFTSTRGSAHSMSRRSMSRLMASGMIRIVSAGLMIDGALDAVAQEALRNSLAQPPAPGDRERR
ncbi:MAG: DUF1631 family protein [Burkholderiaceae bacterium]|mgnify:CR=1 FL=1|nr:DUF1631 family protein [Burkholderiaceae bacterium]